MRLFHLIPKLIFIFIIIFYINLNQGCKDPGEYEPGDSLISPPAPPQLIAPPDSTLFSISPDPADIYFEWTPVTGAEFYDIEFSTDSTFDTTYGYILTYKASSYWTIISFYLLGDIFWRVRAYSQLWTWYTNWSEIGYFKTTSAL